MPLGCGHVARRTRSGSLHEDEGDRSSVVVLTRPHGEMGRGRARDVVGVLEC